MMLAILNDVYGENIPFDNEAVELLFCDKSPKSRAFEFAEI